MIANAGTVAQNASLYREGSLDIDLASRMVQGHGSRAEREAKKRLGSSEDYDTIVGQDGSADQDEQDEYDALLEAESLLVFYYALPYFNLRMTKKGGLQRRTGLVEDANDLMSQAEMNAYRQRVYRDAIEIIEDLADEADRPVVLHL